MNSNEESSFVAQCIKFQNASRHNISANRFIIEFMSFFNHVSVWVCNKTYQGENFLWWNTINLDWQGELRYPDTQNYPERSVIWTVIKSKTANQTVPSRKGGDILVGRVNKINLTGLEVGRGRIKTDLVDIFS